MDCRQRFPLFPAVSKAKSYFPKLCLRPGRCGWVDSTDKVEEFEGWILIAVFWMFKFCFLELLS